MARIDFYHLQKFRLEDALPKLLDRVLKSGQRAVVVAGSDDRAEDLALLLWEDRDSWLPHGTRRDGHPDEQPVWLTDDPLDNANGATILVLCDGMDSPLAETLGRTLNLFNGLDESAVQDARDRWKRWGESGHELHYWQQDDSGRWSEKASRNVSQEAN